MSLFPNEDILTQEIESWKGFADSLQGEERATFIKVLDDCYKYSKAIDEKGRPFPSEPLIMALLFSQHKLTVWMKARIQIKYPTGLVDILQGIVLEQCPFFI